MKKGNVTIFYVAIIVFLIAFMYKSFNLPEGLLEFKNYHSITQNLSSSEMQPSSFKVPRTGIQKLMGQRDTEIRAALGKPERVDSTQYGYSWWIYGRNTEKYLQIGIADHKVVTIYALGNQLKTAPFKIGENTAAISEKIDIPKTVALNYKGASIKFEPSSEEDSVTPLLKSGNAYVQLYYDHFTNKLDAVRYLDAKTLVIMHPYTLVYRGAIPRVKDPSPSLWSKIEKAEDQEIFDYTNIERARHGLRMLRWSEPSSKMALNHSKDMYKNHYFSHDSPTAGTLGDRLEAAHILYNMAGENIAAKYVDGLSAMEGWMNSEGHRENILNKTFTQLGVGVYRDEYTQDFLTPLL